jgi:ribosomal protein S18 acetylase RimI-like enzyme
VRRFSFHFLSLALAKAKENEKQEQCVGEGNLSSDIDFRAALAEDFEFLFRLHKEVMREYVEDTWGAWDDDWQRDDYRKQFLPGNLQIIQVQGRDIGALFIQERAEEIFIASLEILPEYQRQGIGSAVMQGLVEAAAKQDKPVALQVLKVNRGARSLYQRLGFGVTGENDTHYIMDYEHRRG